MIFKRRAQQGRTAERKAMIDRNHALPVSQQAKALRLSRGSLYYKPAPVSEHELGVMHRLDQLHVAHPLVGSWMLRDLLRLEGFCVGRKHVRTLMKRMGIEALYCQPRTTQANRGHPVYPYLLRNLYALQSSVGLGHQLHPNDSWICLSDRDPRLV